MVAYWIARVTVHDADGYGEYAKRAGPAITQHGGRFLARGGKYMPLEGRDHPRNVVILFPSMEQALTCYNSPEYKEALAFSKTSADRDVCIVEGVEEG
jgi:uncharacterized protein (DUF1330 family)